MAKPLPYDKAIGDIICDRLANGENLKQICAGENDGIPCEATVYRWLRADENFSEQYARARKDWADAQVEEIIEIADTEKDPAIARVKIDTRKWAMGKLNGKYSDKLKHVGGDEGDAPIRTVTGIEWTVVDPAA
jgi:serine protease inhibitor